MKIDRSTFGDENEYKILFYIHNYFEENINSRKELTSYMHNLHIIVNNLKSIQNSRFCIQSCDVYLSHLYKECDKFRKYNKKLSTGLKNYTYALISNIRNYKLSLYKSQLKIDKRNQQLLSKKEFLINYLKQYQITNNFTYDKNIINSYYVILNEHYNDLLSMKLELTKENITLLLKNKSIILH